MTLESGSVFSYRAVQATRLTEALYEVDVAAVRCVQRTKQVSLLRCGKLAHAKPANRLCIQGRSVSKCPTMPFQATAQLFPGG